MELFDYFKTNWIMICLRKIKMRKKTLSVELNLLKPTVQLHQ